MEKNTNTKKRKNTYFNQVELSWKARRAISRHAHSLGLTDGHLLSKVLRDNYPKFGETADWLPNPNYRTDRLHLPVRQPRTYVLTVNLTTEEPKLQMKRIMQKVNSDEKLLKKYFKVIREDVKLNKKLTAMELIRYWIMLELNKNYFKDGEKLTYIETLPPSSKRKQKAMQAESLETV